MKKKKVIVIGFLTFCLLLGAWIWMIGFHEGKYSSKETPFNVPRRIVQALQEKKKSKGKIPALEARSKQLVRGISAPDFSGPGLESGQIISLTDYLGNKIILLEFWSSWCGDCRRLNGHLWDLYAKNQDKGFEIISISMDRNFRSWKKAVEKDQLSWPQICDGMGIDSELIKNYGVHSLPMNFLINKAGEIEGKHLSIKELEDWLDKNL